jgi:addiction module HigA family antidote
MTRDVQQSGTGGGILTDPPEVAPPLPGWILRNEILHRMGMRQAELARAMGISRVRISQILHGRAPISTEMALRLGQVTGTAPDYWLRLQREFDLFQANRRLRPVLDKLPILEMAEDGGRAHDVEPGSPPNAGDEAFLIKPGKPK